MSPSQTVVNPATAKPITTIPVPDRAEVDAAIEQAGEAWRSWRDSTVAQRVDLVRRIAAVITANADDLTRMLTLEQGKPTAEARVEVVRSAEILEEYAQLVDDLGDVLLVERGADYRRTYEAIGVVAGIIPWNFPLVIVAMKTAPALLAGNAIILKPAPTTPLTTIEFGRLVAEIAPAHLVQVLADDGSVGPVLASHPGVRKIAFTGSTVNGRNVMAAGASRLKRLTLELGGNDPAIVLPDADPDAVADAIFTKAFYNAGQVCGAIKRLYVHDDVYDGLVAALADRIRTTVVGDGLDLEVTIGPVQNRAQFEKAQVLLAQAAADGEILAQSAAPEADGYFVPVTLVGGLAEDHPLVQQEQFAPVLPILRYSDIDDAIARANASDYGLSASVWTADVARGEELVQRIDAGLRCVNRHNELGANVGISMAKQSGSGWLFGLESLREYQQAHVLYR